MGKLKNFRSVMCGILFLMAVVFCVPTLKAEAASKTPKIASKETVYVQKYSSSASYRAVGYSQFIYLKNVASDAKVTVKSSNKNVYIDYVYTNTPVVVIYDTDKPGTKTTITVKVKQNGKTYKLKCNVTFKLGKTYNKVTIGSKNLTAKADKYQVFNVKGLDGKKLKVSVKMASKKKFVKLYYFTKDGYNSDRGKAFKNGSKITLKKGDYIEIHYKDKYRPKNYTKQKNFSGDCITVINIK